MRITLGNNFIVSLKLPYRQTTTFQDIYTTESIFQRKELYEYSYQHFVLKLDKIWVLFI